MLFMTSLCSATVSVAKVSATDSILVQTQARITHAHELLGRGYNKSAVKMSEETIDMNPFVKALTRKFLSKKYKKSSAKIAKEIVQVADRYGFDPVFLIAVIQNESSFNPNRLGSAGEIGLMQIKPATAEWIADIYDIDYENSKSLLDPVMNIRLGAALLDKLRHQFDSESRLYVSAYNIGAKKTRSLVNDKKTPKEYVVAVMKRYFAIYSAFKVAGDWTSRGEIAFNHTRSLTQKKILTN